MDGRDPLFEIFPDPASRIGADYRIREQNRASRTLFGERAGEICYAAYFGHERPCLGCLAPRVVSHEVVERWFMSHGGVPGEHGTTYYEVTLVPPGGHAPEFIEVLRDVTASLGVEYHLMHDSERLEGDLEAQRREAEDLARRTETLQQRLAELQDARAAMLQTEKLATIGSLAAGMAHEIHTPLGTILSSLDLLGKRLARVTPVLENSEGGLTGADLAGLRAELPALREIFDLLRLAAERIRTIVGSLRLFAHLDRATMERVDPHEGIEAALALLAHDMRGRVDVVREYGAIPAILCRPDAMNQVYMNLLQNAVHAIDGRGSIRVVTRLAEPGVVEIAFHDTGHGIPPEMIEKIFEPGVTSKPRGIGTGLGLAIVTRTVADHGGTVSVESTPGEGSTFTVRLPVGMSQG